MKDLMPENGNENIRRYSAYGAVISFILLVAFLGYGRLWEERQPKQQISNSRVERITAASRGELFSSGVYRIYLEGNPKPIYLPRDKVPSEIRTGYSVDAVVRQSFFGGELEGLAISAHK